MQASNVLNGDRLMAIANLLVQPAFNYWFCLMIVLAAVLVSAWFLFRVLSIARIFSAIIRDIQPGMPRESLIELGAGYEPISADWTGFCESLQYREDIGQYVRVDDPDQFFQFDAFAHRALMNNIPAGAYPDSDPDALW
jgi:hypothetical protein